LDPGTLYGYIPSSLKEELLSRGAESRLPFSLTKDEYTVLMEPMSSAATVFIAGAGHVGQATARLTAFTGFRTVVLDDRADFLSADRLPEADKLHQVKGFEDCFKDIQVGPESFIVILTRGHVHDKTVLAQALQTSARYIGMIGSRKKREAIYQALREEGFSQMDLERVHCPIGLSIGADTPEEIAVSIIAELIQERSRVA
jgi:xanthine dehydrogenase accessory factor